MDRLDNALNKIPGYTDHRDREDRRDDNKRIRSMAAQSLYNAIDDLTAYTAELASDRELSEIGRVETLIDHLRTLADRVRSASYGYAGIRTDDAIDASALDKLREFDLDLREDLDALTDTLKTITNTMPPNGDIIRTATTTIRDLNHRLNDRKYAAHD